MARKQEDPVKLSDAEREELEAIVSKGKHKARVIRRAQPPATCHLPPATCHLPLATCPLP